MRDDRLKFVVFVLIHSGSAGVGSWFTGGNYLTVESVIGVSPPPCVRVVCTLDIQLNIKSQFKRYVFPHPHLSFPQKVSTVCWRELVTNTMRSALAFL